MSSNSIPMAVAVHSEQEVLNNLDTLLRHMRVLQSDVKSMKDSTFSNFLVSTTLASSNERLSSLLERLERSINEVNKIASQTKELNENMKKLNVLMVPISEMAREKNHAVQIQAEGHTLRVKDEIFEKNAIQMSKDYGISLTDAKARLLTKTKNGVITSIGNFLFGWEEVKSHL